MKVKKSPGRGVWVIVVAFILVAAFLGALLFKKHETAVTPASPVETLQGAKVTLFFAAQGGEGLVREWREIEPCAEPELCFEQILEELINGPLGDSAAPVLPLTGMFNAVTFDGSTAHVDFAPELLEALPAGSSSELLATYAVINSICFNYPQVKQVLFTVDGKRLETLKGHVEVDKPLSPDYTLEAGAKVAPPAKVKKQ